VVGHSENFSRLKLTFSAMRGARSQSRGGDAHAIGWLNTIQCGLIKTANERVVLF
jgi:hypothetical protein